MIVPVILSGGAGTRLWPLSREAYPKQFLPLTEERTLLQATVGRLEGLAGLKPVTVVCNEDHRFLVAEQLRQAGHPVEAIVLEPVGRNTAPAVAAVAQKIVASGEDDLLLVLAADHLIPDEASFRRAVAAAATFAEKGRMITFGVVPTVPETGYGYIRGSERLRSEDGEEALRVEQFVEKPDLETANRYLDSGQYFWNSGMFMFRASDFLAELKKHAPDILENCGAAVDKAARDMDFVRLDPESFAACRSDSIDYAVMEKTTDAVVIPLDAGWSDVGSWSALWETGGKDRAGNVVAGDVLCEGVSNSYLRATSRLVAAVGLDCHVVVETADAVLVAHKDRVQDVKAIVNRLAAGRRSEAVVHSRVYRPWGAYETIDIEERFQVKRITVNPGAALSLQLHHHRAEHWIVVRGTARVTCGDMVRLLEENQSTYIPLGTAHRLENPGKIPLQLIEVQSGSYLGEDDIVRFDDHYGRGGGRK